MTIEMVYRIFATGMMVSCILLLLWVRQKFDMGKFNLADMAVIVCVLTLLICVWLT